MTEQKGILSNVPELLFDIGGYLFFFTIVFGSVTTLVFLLIGKNSQKPALLVLFALLAILLITGPSLFENRNKQRAIKILCRYKLNELALFVTSEITDGKFEKEKWCDLIKPKLECEDTFKCVGDNLGPCSYAVNKNIPANANDLPSDLVLLFESAPSWNKTGGPEDVVTDRHNEPGANIAFADGHVEFVKPEDIPRLRWTVTRTAAPSE